MKHIKKFNEIFYFGGEQDKAKEWWNGLEAEKQQELASKYFPEKDFDALSMTNDDITKVSYK